MAIATSVSGQFAFRQLEMRTQTYTGAAGPLIDLSIGNPDGVMPLVVADALSDATRELDICGYPALRGDPRFLAAAAAYLMNRFGTSFDPAREIIALPGTKEGIAQFLFTALEPGDVVLIPDIHYPVYARAAAVARAEVVLLETRADHDFLPDWSHVPAALLRRARAIILNYPNNPTGAVAPLAFWEQAVAFARLHDLVLVSDAAYAELGFGEIPPPSVFNVAGAREVAVEFHSLSKSFNMAGLRLGFVAGDSMQLEPFLSFRAGVVHGPPTAIQRAGARALAGYAELTAPTRAMYRSRRDVVVTALRSVGWDVRAPDGGMYVWFAVPDAVTDTDDWEWTGSLLYKTGIALTHGSAFGPGGSGFVRLSLVRDEATLGEVARRIGEYSGMRSA